MRKIEMCGGVAGKLKSVTGSKIGEKKVRAEQPRSHDQYREAEKKPNGKDVWARCRK